MNLGAILRQKRKEKKLTLKMVSERAGISEGFLSQVENDVNSPSVDTLVKICGSIGIEAGDVLNQVSKMEKFVVIRKSEWKDAELPTSGFITRRFYAPENRSVIDSSVLVLETGRQIPVRKNIKNSQEVLTVLHGAVELVLGDNTLTLSQGDSVHYWSVPDRQMITNTAKDLAVVLWVGTQ